MKTNQTNGKQMGGFVQLIVLWTVVHLAFGAVVYVQENADGGGTQPGNGPWPTLPTMP